MTRPGDWAREALHYRFTNTALLDQALTHRSASSTHNERLEFLGDAVLGLVVAEALYELHPSATEGAMSRLRARLVRRSTLETVAREIDLGRWLQLGSGELRAGGHHRASILANSLEAVFGAVFIDGEYPEANRVIRKLLEPRIMSLTERDELRDPKTRLQEWLQARGLRLPVYEVSDIGGTPHAQFFTVVCRVEDADLQVAGTGSSRRSAEQDAAAQALDRLAHER